MSLTNRQEAFEAIRSADNLGPGPKLLLVFVGDLVADGGTLNVGCDWLAAELGESRSSVQRWRRDLVEAELLSPKLTTKGGRSNIYRLTFTAHPPPTNRPPTAHQPPTHGREQEQEQEPGARSQSEYWRNEDPDYLRWAEERTARRKGSPALLEKILAEDHHIYLSERTESTTDPSPERDDPATCPHESLSRITGELRSMIDEEGYCARCSDEELLPSPTRLTDEAAR